MNPLERIIPQTVLCVLATVLPTGARGIEKHANGDYETRYERTRNKFVDQLYDLHK